MTIPRSVGREKKTCKLLCVYVYKCLIHVCNRPCCILNLAVQEESEDNDSDEEVTTSACECLNVHRCG